MMHLITNHSGSFSLFDQVPLSRYHGIFFWLDGRMYRAIAFFDLKKKYGRAVDEVWRVRRAREDVEESFWFVKGQNVFFYELSKKSDFDVVLDCKENFDNREWGRFYGVEELGGTLVVHFSKRNDVHESPGSEFDVFLAFHGGFSFSKVDKWEIESYPDDELRKSRPFERWVYRLGTLSSSSVAVACALSRDEAIALAKDAFEFRAANEKRSRVVLPNYNGVKRACARAVQSLLSLRAADGLFAGLPWFHQRWLRDEVISSNALMLVGEAGLAKDIIFYWLDKMRDDGSFPGTLTETIADGAWVFVRLLDYLKKCKLSKAEKDVVSGKLKVFLGALNQSVVENASGETWMDAVYGDDARAGARVEVNALALAACRLARELKAPFEYEDEFRKGVRDVFWTGSYLKDGADDKTVRPNVFIAAYVCPELLSRQQWQKCFDYVLPKLWLKWGGLASICKTSKLFCSRYSGEDSRSYHRGDSWFWINNLAAIVLHRVNKKKYARYIKKIVDSSAKEILELGAVGHHAEISDARALSSRGCLAQAWSDAMFIELCYEFGYF